MTDKVRLTEEQHVSLKYATTHQSSQSIVKSRVFGDIDKDLMELRLDELIRALYIGYEVEPEFAVGQWFKNKTDGDIGKVTRVDETGVHADNGMGGDTFYFRRATDSEISQEKERRWWSKHGRGVWELRRGDILGKNLVASTVYSTNDETVQFNELGINKTWGVVKNEYTVICFTESRLDRSEDE